MVFQTQCSRESFPSLSYKTYSVLLSYFVAAKIACMASGFGQEEQGLRNLCCKWLVTGMFPRSGFNLNLMLLKSHMRFTFLRRSLEALSKDIISYSNQMKLIKGPEKRSLTKLNTEARGHKPSWAVLVLCSILTVIEFWLMVPQLALYKWHMT